MNIENRDYFRRREPEPSSFGSMLGGARFWSMTTWIIAVLIAMRFLGVIFQQVIIWLYFSPALGIYELQLWRILTYSFVDTDRGLFGFIFALISLYFFGRMVEDWIGSTRFLVFYLSCAAAGAVTLVVFQFFGAFGIWKESGIAGPYAATLGVLIAAAKIAPNANAQFMFVLQVPLKVLAWILVGLTAYYVVASGNRENLAQLGGAALGWILINNLSWLNFVDRINTGGLARWTQTKKREWDNHREQQLESEVDRILDKVHHEGMASLTEKEKKTLNDASRQRKNRRG